MGGTERYPFALRLPLMRGLYVKSMCNGDGLHPYWTSLSNNVGSRALRRCLLYEQNAIHIYILSSSSLYPANQRPSFFSKPHLNPPINTMMTGLVFIKHLLFCLLTISVITSAQKLHAPQQEHRLEERSPIRNYM